MYLQITTRCNMRCRHCCFACTSKGQDMSLTTFRNALQISKEFGSLIALGGGEPTIHPLFWQFLCEAIAKTDDTIWLATNGKETEIAIALAKMAEKGVIGCALSQDEYHEPIEYEVISAFEQNKRRTSVGFYDPPLHDLREIHNVTGKEIKAGRQKKGRDECRCEGLFCKPNGDVYPCACKDAPLFGNVNKRIVLPENWDIVECYNVQRK